MAIESGLVAFFDILGYQNIIQNNEIERVSSLISGTLTKLPELVKKSVKEQLNKDLQSLSESSRENLDTKYLSKIETRLISDSILSSVVFKLDPKSIASSLQCWLFLLYVARLVREMFNIGLPVRGAIGFGKFFIEGQCFAGMPIIDCYRIAQQLEFSGVVLTDESYKELKKVNAEAPYVLSPIEGFLYLVPQHNGDEKMFILDWWEHEKDNADIRQLVFESFRKHNKDVAEGALKKLRNTEFSIRAFIQRKKERILPIKKAQ